MAVYKGSTSLSAAYVGSTAATKIYLGSTEVWSSAQTPTYESKGGANSATGTPANLSWSHTIGATNGLVITALSIAAGVGSLTSAWAKVGTTSMDPISSLFQYYTTGSYYYYIQLFGMYDPPTGAQTMTAGGADRTNWAVANSIAYNNVSGTRTVQTNTGSGTSLSHTVTSGQTGDLIVQMFAMDAASGTISSYNKTQEWNQTGSSTAQPCVFGDAAGSTSVGFTATGPSSVPWGSVGVPLIPG